MGKEAAVEKGVFNLSLRGLTLPLLGLTLLLLGLTLSLLGLTLLLLGLTLPLLGLALPLLRLTLPLLGLTLPLLGLTLSLLGLTLLLLGLILPLLGLTLPLLGLASPLTYLSHVFLPTIRRFFMRDTYLLLLALLALMGTAACAPTTSPPAMLTVPSTLTATPLPTRTLDPVSATATAEMAPYLTPLSLTPTPWIVWTPSPTPFGLVETAEPTTTPNPTPLGGYLTCAEVVESHPDDCQALYDLFMGTGGANWHYSNPAQNNWFTTTSVCDWYGIFCEEESGRVNQLLLNKSNLVGFIPPTLGNMTKLVRIELSLNSLSGNIPPELANLPNLQHLWVNGNALSGDLPPELANLTNLLQLSVAGNPNLSGALPLALADLPVRTLHFADTAVCAPNDPTFQQWLNRLDSLDSRLVSGGLICP